VAYWRLDELTGTVCHDLMGTVSGTYGSGITLGQPSALTHDPDPSIALDGTNNGVVLFPYSAAISGISDSIITIEAWVKTISTSQYNMIFSTDFGPGTQTVQLYVKSGSACVYSNQPGGDQCDNSIVNDGKWHYLTGVWNGTQAFIFVDGNLTKTIAGASFGAAASNSSFRIGAQCYPTGGCATYEGQFPGQIDEVAVYHRALPAAQILNHFNAQ